MVVPRSVRKQRRARTHYISSAAAVYARERLAGQEEANRRLLIDQKEKHAEEIAFLKQKLELMKEINRMKQKG